MSSPNPLALQLLAKFAFKPNQLGYCGMNSANKPLYNCITKGDCEPIMQEIRSFKGLFAYLKTIAEVSGKNIFDFLVIEAYWIGNDLLKKFKPEHYDILVKNLASQNLPDFFIQKIAGRKPKVFIPLHLFNILHIGVGEISGTVETNLENINNCMIRWGRVETMNQQESTAAVYLIQLVQDENQIYQLKTTDEIIPFHPDLTPNLKPNDMVAVHWNQITKVLSQTEQTHLAFWTNTLLHSL